MTVKDSSLLRRLADRHGYAAVPLGLLVCLLALAAVRGPHLFTSDGAAYAIVSAAPLIMATMALTPIAMAGRGGVDLAIGPLVGFVNVGLVFWLIKSGVTSPLFIIAFAIKKTMGIRISPDEEATGIDAKFHRDSAYALQPA